MTTERVAKPQNSKRRHHFIPVAYLRHFTDAGGKIFAFRKHTDQQEPIHTTPRNIALIRDYYSQPKPDGEWDHNALEDLFDRKVESKWPALVARIRQRDNINDALEPLFGFIAALRVRVPAARDAAELMQAAMVKSTMRLLDKKGKLPSLPQGITIDHFDVAINPHASIHAMPTLVKGFAIVLKGLGFEILCNETDVPLLTNDNPVMYFDADRPMESLQPYQSDPYGGRVELLVPIDTHHVLRGHPALKSRHGRKGIAYARLKGRDPVRRINKLTAMFGYDFVFADSTIHKGIIKEHANISPVLKTERIPQPDGGSLLHYQSVFGPRPRKPKWTEKAS